MNRTQFNVKQVSFAEEQDQQQIAARFSFILTDFQPNGNNEAIPIEEKENIIRTAQLVPVKASTETVQRTHANAIPIGPIVNVRDGGDIVIAEALLWKHEFPDLYDELKQLATEDPTQINFSWEVMYEQSYVENGIRWLQGCTVTGVALVDQPAYRGRTHLIAIAAEHPQEPSVTVSDVVQEVTEQPLPEQPPTEQSPLVSDQQLTMLLEELEQLRRFKDRVEQEQRKAARAQQLEPYTVPSATEPARVLIEILTDEQFTHVMQFIRSTVEYFRTQAQPQIAQAQYIDPVRIPNELVPSPSSVMPMLIQALRKWS